jgi:hypothetical protein
MCEGQTVRTDKETGEQAKIGRALASKKERGGKREREREREDGETGERRRVDRSFL